MISYDETKEYRNTKLYESLEAALTYQDIFALYTQWTQGSNNPEGINKALYDKIQFTDGNNNIVPLILFLINLQLK